MLLIVRAKCINYQNTIFINHIRNYTEIHRCESEIFARHRELTSKLFEIRNADEKKFHEICARLDLANKNEMKKYEKQKSAGWSDIGEYALISGGLILCGLTFYVLFAD